LPCRSRLSPIAALARVATPSRSRMSSQAIMACYRSGFFSSE
jgi:hypothetical protein